MVPLQLPPLGHSQWPTERAGNVAQGLVDLCRQMDMGRCGPDQSRYNVVLNHAPLFTDVMSSTVGELV